MMRFLLVVWLTVAGVQGATSYYVDPDVAAGGSGSAASPWNTPNWSTVNSALASGDVTIYYSALEQSGASPETVATWVHVQRSDTSANRLTVDGHSFWNTSDASPSWQGNATAISAAYRTGKVCKITGNGSQALGWTRGSANPKQSNVTLRGFECTGAGARMGFAGDNVLVEWIYQHHVTGIGPGMTVLYTFPDNGTVAGDRLFSECTGITIADCWVESVLGEGIYIGATNPDLPDSLELAIGNELFDMEVLRTTVKDVGIGGGEGDGIDCKNGIVGLRIEGCDISGFNGLGGIVMSQVYTNVYQQAVITGNTIHDAQASGAERYGIYLVSSTPKYGFKGVEVSRNTIYGCPHGIYGNGAGSALEQVTVDNNTVRGNATTGITLINSDSGVTVTDNLMLGNGTAFNVSGLSAISGNYHNGLAGTGSGTTALTSADAATALAQGWWLTAGVVPTGTVPVEHLFDAIVAWDWTTSGLSSQVKPSWFPSYNKTVFAGRVTESGLTSGNMVTAVKEMKRLGFGYLWATDVTANNAAPSWFATLAAEVPKLRENTAYQVRVRKVAPDVGQWSNVVTLTTGVDAAPPPTPSAPTLSGVATGSTTVQLSWNNVGAQTYELQRDAGTIFTGSGLIYTDSGRSPSTSYAYRVRALTPVASAYSGTVNVTTDALPPTPPPGGYRFIVPDSYAGAGNAAKLQAAFSDSRLVAGDRVLIRAGTYAGTFDITVTQGTLTNPIWFVGEAGWTARIVSPGERSTRAPHPTILSSVDSQGWGLYGLEVYCSNTDRNNEAIGSQLADPPGQYMPVPIGIQSRSNYAKIVHCYVHDSRQGIVSQTERTLYPEFYGNILSANGWANYEPHLSNLRGIRLWQGPNFYLQHGGWVGGQFLGLDSPGAIIEMNILCRSGYWMSGQFYGSDAASAENCWWQRNIAIGDPTEAAGTGYIGVLPMEHMVGGLGKARLRLGRVLGNLGWNSVLTVGYGSANRNANARIEDNYAYVATGDTYPDLRYAGGIHANKISSAPFPFYQGTSNTDISRLAFNPETDQPATFLRNTIIRQGTTANDPMVRMLNDSGGQANWQSGGNTFMGNLRFEFDGGSPTGEGGESVWRQVMRDQTSTFTATLPVVDRTFVFASKYNFWGPMLYVANYDWDGNNSCTFNPASSGFTSGTYKIYNAQDMTAGGAVLAAVAPVATGTYSGGNMTVSSAGWTKSQMNNPDPRIANPYSYATDGTRRFNVFILTR